MVILSRIRWSFVSEIRNENESDLTGVIGHYGESGDFSYHNVECLSGSDVRYVLNKTEC